MKRRVGWVAGVGCVGVALAFILGVQRQEKMAAVAEAAWGKKEVAKAETIPATQKSQAQSVPAAPREGTGPSAGQGGQEKIAFTFENDAKLQEFTNLSRQRQGIMLRMNVLQSYFTEEQAALAQLNNKVTTDYHLDLTKNYFLDDKRRVLIERETPPAPQPALAPVVQPSPPSASSPKP